MNWDMLKRRLAWAQIRTRMLQGSAIETPYEPFVTLDDISKERRRQVKATAKIQTRKCDECDGVMYTSLTNPDEFRCNLCRCSWFGPTVEFDPPLFTFGEGSTDASGAAFMHKHRQVLTDDPNVPAKEHIMHMKLDPAKVRFIQGYDIGQPLPTPRQCRFQYEGVNLHTYFTWDGTDQEYWKFKEFHMEETVKYLNRHGISTEIVRYDTK